MPNVQSGQVQLWGNIVVLVANIIVLCTAIIKSLSLNKELKNAKIVVNNLSDLKNALSKQLEGVWIVNGSFSKYHNVAGEHISKGSAIFVWDDINKRYSIYYNYAVQKTQNSADIVTAICKGFTSCNEDGTVKDNEQLKLQMSIVGRCASDGFNEQATNYDLISEPILAANGKVKELRFKFSVASSEGTIQFLR